MLGFVGDAVSAVGAVVDKFVTTDTERATAKREIEQVLNERLKLVYEDVKSAREMQVVAIQSGDVFVRRFGNLFALLFVTLFFALTALLMFVDMPQQAENVLNIIFGGMIAGLHQILGFFYGSSQGSREKDLRKL